MPEKPKRDAAEPSWRERLGDIFFKNIYRGSPPWDIGRPQPEFVALAEAGAIRGDVLDAGCGTGDNALFLAERGCRVVGFDFAPLAIAKAKVKARARNLSVEFVLDNALAPRRVVGEFDAVIDSGLFHVFNDKQQPRYVASLARWLRPGGRLFILCFSDRVPGSFGPRRLSEGQIRAAFGDGWLVRDIRPAPFAAKHEGGALDGWLASIERKR